MWNDSYFLSWVTWDANGVLYFQTMQFKVLCFSTAECNKSILLSSFLSRYETKTNGKASNFHQIVLKDVKGKYTIKENPFLRNVVQKSGFMCNRFPQMILMTIEMLLG